MPITAPTVTTRPATLDRAADRPQQPPAKGLVAAVCVLAAFASLAGVFGGPALGDHEAIVAQTSREMRLSGDWVLPTFMGQPWFRKPPLPYWLVAGTSYLFPNDPQTGLPVTPVSARLPSGLAALGTILLLWKLASAMFGPRAGIVTAVIASSTILFLLYAPNATAEMPLTFCCVWAYLHFWYAVTAKQPGRQRLHMLLFYVALGMGMLAKGPAPVAMVGLPLAIWWYTHRPLRILARRLGGRASSSPEAGEGPSCPPSGLPRTSAFKLAFAGFLRGLWPRTRESFTKLWLIPGLFLFALFFVPWMLVIAGLGDILPARVPHAWAEWNWQYVQRAQGDYLDSKDRPVWYYLPYVAGFIAPWIFLLPEGLAAPWLKRYARCHRPLLYCGLWMVVAVLVMSLESFKKPYYILPALPGLILLMGVVANRFYSQPVQPRKWMWGAWAAAALGFTAAVIAGVILLNRDFPDVAGRLTIIMVLAAVLMLVAGAIHIQGRPWVAFGTMAVATLVTFQSIWHTSGPALDNMAPAEGMAKALAKLPADAEVLWADGRPDARVDFYFNRRTAAMIPPSEIVTRILDRKAAKQDLQLMAVSRAIDLLKDTSRPIYLIWERGNYERARSLAGLRGHVLAEIPRGGGTKKNWVVVTNCPSSPSTQQTGSQPGE
ncbi:MAG TPA: glycosyltransferase family 39 protein [Phycisphaerae bacterium]|jgi:4-amino-4-deoxy-L-arabinose transferase-like glycosyltransferase|nr:glycosyltransferase family 39 protein [Phycisphaerae bacterium]HOJ55521.1 glycosyltransferase family 39 protein [Phycisphaerae bacterium]HOL26031.1 glycosyltransferase family 39 protein [Phycisphaerae bacterium]HPP22551.1 glycosyltransferase family 39 protein [Phycisphaerae bacterium]HPU33354.1 glycosyltransferase family 39 protein [Phycisphaerae bacterium]